MSELNYEKVFNVLVQKTKDYIVKNNLKAMVLGISGGIDSTVVAAICHEVSKQTGIPLIGRSLPIKNKNDEFDVSKLVGEAFCDDFKVVGLTDAYWGVLDEILENEAGIKNTNATAVDMYGDTYRVYNPDDLSTEHKVLTPIAKGNIQARLRMIYLYNLASINKGLVMSTDNQTEYQLGFWTIHGDVGDFDPIQDLWKTEVYKLAKWLEYKYGHDGVTASTADESTFNIQAMKAMQASIALTPTDGLGISNSDLDQIGAKSYAEVDDILQTLIPICEWKPELGTIQMNLDRLYDKYGQEVIDKVWDRHTASGFKRKKSPIYIEREEYAS